MSSPAALSRKKAQFGTGRDTSCGTEYNSYDDTWYVDSMQGCRTSVAVGDMTGIHALLI